MRKVYPHTIYRHFKGKYYATVAESAPCTPINLEALKNSCSGYHYYLEPTIITGDENKKIKVLLLATDNHSFNLYHSSIDCNDNLVIYKSLYDDTTTYARTKSDFLSPVDREKYPNVEQDNRFSPYVNIGFNA